MFLPTTLLLFSLAQTDAVRIQETRTLSSAGMTYGAEAGQLRVPQNRDREESGTITLGFIRLHSTAEDPGPPLFFLPGGPGNAATPMAPSPAWVPFLEVGDVVLLDPRGTGRSGPDLEWSSDDLDPGLFFGYREDAVEHMAEVCEAAAADLAERGVDLAGFNTAEMVEDVNDLREGLGYERVNLMGHSYGTLLGLSYLRRYEKHVGRFVSVGTAGPGDMQKLPSELDRSLAELAKTVAADPTIGADMPDLVADLRAVLEDLDEDPLPVPVRDPRSGERRDVLLGPFGLRLILVADLADTADLPVFPRLIRTLQERDPSVVQWFLQKRLSQFGELPIMMLAVRGAQGATEARWKRIRKEARASSFGLSRCLFSPESDAALGLRDVGDPFREDIESRVPTLFISGTDAIPT